MPGNIPVSPKLSFQDAAGGPLANGTLTVTLTGTSTPSPTWQDQAQTTLNTNPIVLDARGECLCWLDPVITYRFVLKDAGGATIWTVDNISGSASASSVAALQAQVNSIGGSSGRFVFVDDYGTNTVPGTTDMTAAFYLAFAAVGSGGTLMMMPTDYRTTSELQLPIRSGFTFKGSRGSNGSGGSRIVGVHTGRSVLNIYGSESVTIEDVTLHGDVSDSPQTGLLGGTTNGTDGGGFVSRNLAITGNYTNAGLYVTGMRDAIFDNCDIRVTATSAAAYIGTSSGILPLTPGTGYATYGIRNIKFIGGIIENQSPTSVSALRVDLRVPTGGVSFNGTTISKNANNTYVQIACASGGSLEPFGPLTFLDCKGIKYGATPPTNGFDIEAGGGNGVYLSDLTAHIDFDCGSKIFNVETGTGTILHNADLSTLNRTTTLTSQFYIVRGSTLNLKSEASITFNDLYSSVYTAKVAPTVTAANNKGNLIKLTDGGSLRLLSAYGSGVSISTRDTNVNIAIDASLGNTHILTNTFNSNWTMNAPLNPTEGQVLNILIDNLSAGNIVVTFNTAIFKNIGNMLITSPNGRGITFVYASGLWLELSRTSEYDF